MKNAGYEFAFIRISDGASFQRPEVRGELVRARSRSGSSAAPISSSGPSQNVTAQADMMIAAIGTLRSPAICRR